MKKIQIGTVRQTADVEVLFINANLIAKAIRANDAIQNIIEYAKAEGDIIPRYQPKLDQNGEPVMDEHGYPIDEPALDDKGNHITDYSGVKLDCNDLMRINTQVATFLKELVNAFESLKWGTGNRLPALHPHSLPNSTTHSLLIEFALIGLY